MAVSLGERMCEVELQGSEEPKVVAVVQAPLGQALADLRELHEVLARRGPTLGPDTQELKECPRPKHLDTGVAVDRRSDRLLQRHCPLMVSEASASSVGPHVVGALHVQHREEL